MSPTPLCICETFFCPPGSVSVVFVRYDSVGDILKPSGDPGLTDYSRYAGTGEITVNSPVIAAAVKPADIYQLDHVTFTLRHNEVKTVQSADPGYIVFPTIIIDLHFEGLCCSQ